MSIISDGVCLDHMSIISDDVNVDKVCIISGYINVIQVSIIADVAYVDHHVSIISGNVHKDQLSVISNDECIDESHKNNMHVSESDVCANKMSLNDMYVSNITATTIVNGSSTVNSNALCELDPLIGTLKATRAENAKSLIICHVNVNSLKKR